MKDELTVIIKEAPEGGYWATCPEIPGANGQGETIAEATINLEEAANLFLQDRYEEHGFAGLTDFRQLLT
jgi:predicted RNase H-like HicB family nuclease